MSKKNKQFFNSKLCYFYFHLMLLISIQKTDLIHLLHNLATIFVNLYDLLLNLIKLSLR
jgi:hypothetical protein